MQSPEQTEATAQAIARQVVAASRGSVAGLKLAKWLIEGARQTFHPRIMPVPNPTEHMRRTSCRAIGRVE